MRNVLHYARVGRAIGSFFGGIVLVEYFEAQPFQKPDDCDTEFLKLIVLIGIASALICRRLPLSPPSPVAPKS